MNHKVIIIASLGLILTFTIWYLFDLQDKTQCVSDIEPPTGNSVWNDQDCVWEMHIGMDMGEGFPSEDEISKSANQKIVQKLVNYAIKQYSMVNSTDILEHKLIYKIGDDLVRYVWVVDLETENIVMDYRNHLIGQPSPVLQNSLDFNDMLIADLKNTNQGWAINEVDGQTIMSWMRLYDGLIFGSSFVEKT